MIQKEKKDNPKKENQIKNDDYEQNINKLKEFSEISNLYGKKEIIKKKFFLKKNLLNQQTMNQIYQKNMHLKIYPITIVHLIQYLKVYQIK